MDIAYDWNDPRHAAMSLWNGFERRKRIREDEEEDVSGSVDVRLGSEKRKRRLGDQDLKQEHNVEMSSEVSFYYLPVVDLFLTT